MSKSTQTRFVCTNFVSIILRILTNSWFKSGSCSIRQLFLLEDLLNLGVEIEVCSFRADFLDVESRAFSLYVKVVLDLETLLRLADPNLPGVEHLKYRFCFRNRAISSSFSRLVPEGFVTDSSSGLYSSFGFSNFLCTSYDFFYKF